MKPLKEGGIEEVSKFVFDKTKQYGCYAEIVLGSTIQYGAIFHIVGFDKWCNEAVELAKKWLQREIDKFIPSEYRKLAKWIIKEPTYGDPLLRNGTVGWKYTPKAKS